MKKFLRKNISFLLIFAILFNIVSPYFVFANEEETMIVEFENATIKETDNKTITFDDGEIELEVQFLCDNIPQAFGVHNNNAEVRDVLKNKLWRYDIKITNTGDVDAYLEVFGNIDVPVGETEYRSMADVGENFNGFIQVIRRSPAEVSNILWDYDRQDAIDKGFVNPDGEPDCLVENGRVEIISVQLPAEAETILAEDLTEYEEVWYGKKYNYDAFISVEGESTHATIPVGSIVTVELIPDYGYQVTSAELNGTVLEPDDEIQSRFSFVMPENPLHLQAIFNEVENISNTENSAVINNANVEIDNNEVDSGSVLLTIQDAEVSNEQQEEFEAISTDYEIANYLEIDLDQIIYKGTEEEYWSNSLTELNENAEITMELSEELDGNDVVILHEHEGNYEVLDAEYDDGLVTFETDSFSTYAIAYRTVETKKYTVKNSNCSIEFNYNVGKEFELDTIDYLALTDEELEEIGMTKEVYAQLLAQIKSVLKDDGALLNILEISVVYDERNLTKGPFVFKVKLTDDMKKYNSLKFIFLDEQEDGTFKKGEIIEGKIEGDYLVVTLPHLSAYAIVGDNVEEGKEETSNPKTGDTIMYVVAGLIISAAGAYITKKKFIK